MPMVKARSREKLKLDTSTYIFYVHTEKRLFYDIHVGKVVKSNTVMFIVDAGG